MKGIIFSILLACIAPSPRVAVIDLVGDIDGQAAAVLHTVAEKFAPVDVEQVRAAVRGIGYGGNLNLSCDEARSLGQSIGCDFYFLGRLESTRRLSVNNETCYEAMAGLFLVEMRSGRLLRFDFVRENAASESEARTKLIKTIQSRCESYVTTITEAASRVTEEASLAIANDIEIFDGEVSTKKLQPPIFYQRLQPAYTSEATSIDLVATVELIAIFGADGRVSDIEVTRWAGFGLDESAMRTVRALRFKPAERAGRPISVRALVRYNFRRPQSMSEREAEAEQLRRSLHKIQRP